MSLKWVNALFVYNELTGKSSLSKLFQVFLSGSSCLRWWLINVTDKNLSRTISKYKHQFYSFMPLTLQSPHCYLNPAMIYTTYPKTAVINLRVSVTSGQMKHDEPSLLCLRFIAAPPVWVCTTSGHFLLLCELQLESSCSPLCTVCKCCECKPPHAVKTAAVVAVRSCFHWG